MATIAFSDWVPDQGAIGTVQTVKNVLPFGGGYLPFQALQQQSNALDARCLGALSARDASNNVYFYAGTASKLYELVNATFTDESKAGGYSTAADSFWEFTQYKNLIVATNYDDEVQSITIGGGGAGAFANLFTSTLTPNARHIDAIGRFLVLGNTNDGTDGVQPQRVWWSAIDDPTDMDPSGTTQCDFQDLATGGWVTKIVGGVEYGVVFQEKQIWRMTYVGSPLVFDFHPVDRSIGTRISGSVIGYGRLIFFISEEGFYMFDGQQCIPIGHNKVDRQFWTEFDITNKYRVSAAIDPLHKVVFWAFPGAGSTGGVPNKIWAYSWADQKFSEIDGAGNIEIVTSTQTQGYTLDSLDNVGTDIDNATTFAQSFDSDFWKGGVRRRAAIDTDHKLGFFTGSNLAVTLDSPELQFRPGERSLLLGARPIIDGGTPTVRVGSRNRQIDAASFSASVTINAQGWCPLRTNARYHRLRLEVPASNSWSIAQGFEIPKEWVRPAGRR